MSRGARRRVSIAGTTGLAAAVALAVPAVAAGPKVVPIGDNFFGQDGHLHGVGATRGQVVQWIWTGQRRHNVTVVGGPERCRSSTRRRGTFEQRMR